MLYTLIVDNNEISRSDNEPFVMQFYTNHHTGADAENAVRAAVRKFLKTAKGQETLRHTCGNFNWGDVACHVPDCFYIEQGVIPIPMSEEMSTVVMHDEDLTSAEDEFVVEANITLDITLEEIAKIVRRALASPVLMLTFMLPDAGSRQGQDVEDFIYDALTRNKAITLSDQDDNLHVLTVPKFLDGLSCRIKENSHLFFSRNKNSLVDAIDCFEADKILCCALLGED